MVASCGEILFLDEGDLKTSVTSLRPSPPSGSTPGIAAAKCVTRFRLD